MNRDAVQHERGPRNSTLRRPDVAILQRSNFPSISHTRARPSASSHAHFYAVASTQLSKYIHFNFNGPNVFGPPLLSLASIVHGHAHSGHPSKPSNFQSGYGGPTPNTPNDPGNDEP